MDKYELQKLRNLPIEGVAERLGLQVRRHMALCPFHDDHHPSLSFSVRKNTFRCFVCGESGGTIDLVMKFLNKDFLDACNWLADENNIILTKYKPQPSAISHQPSFDASRYERYFEHPWLNDEARKFLFDERKLDPRVVRWCRLNSWTDRQGIPWLQMPYYNQEGKLIGVQSRNLATIANNQYPITVDRIPRFRFPRGSQCVIYNLPVLNLLQPGEDLYITEGCSDCWAMLSAGHKAIAIPSATQLKRKDVEQLSIIRSTFSRSQGENSQLSIQFHMYPDNDAPGEHLFLQLKEVLPTIVHHQLPPVCKDFGEFFKENQGIQ
jgi:hypothetical protein